MARFAHELESDKYVVFRDTVEIETRDIISAYLDERYERGGTGTLPTTSFAEQALEAKGIQASGGRVDVVRAMFERFGVPVGRGARAFLEENQWMVRTPSGARQRLVDWDRGQRE